MAKTPGERSMRPARVGTDGFTLLEAVLAVSLVIMLLSAAYGFYWHSLRVCEKGRKITDSAQLMRVIVTRMADELRQANDLIEGFGAPVPGGAGSVTGQGEKVIEPEVSSMIGWPGRITFIMQAMPGRELFKEQSIREQPPPGQHDVRLVHYRIVWDEENLDAEGNAVCRGLFRGEVKTLNPYRALGDEWEPIELEQYAPEIKYLELRYFDGSSEEGWTSKWTGGQGNALPQAIRITVGTAPQSPDEAEQPGILDEAEMAEKDAEYHPDRYTMIVRLPGADTFFGSRLVTLGDRLGGGGR